MACPDWRVHSCQKCYFSSVFSAADLYISKYFHPYNEASKDKISLMRVYAVERDHSTVPEDVKLYCHHDGRKFFIPTMEEIQKYHIVIATLSTSRHLLQRNMSGQFSHIFIDEAGQALEAETIMPLAMARKDTCVVLAGDHRQMSPMIYSEDCRELNPHSSLLERLFLHYQRLNLLKQNTSLLCCNYRSSKEIVDYLDEAFYQGRNSLRACKEPETWNCQSLNFYSCMGHEERDDETSSYYNQAEVEEILQVVQKLKEAMPELSSTEIAVVSAYSVQVFFVTALF